jgi:hypothetical protein
VEKTVVTYWFRKDVTWAKPGTGEPDGQFTAEDYEFTCHYIYAQLPYSEGADFGCPHYDRFKDIHHIDIINDYEVKVYMDVNSMWAYQWPTYPLLPRDVWLDDVKTLAYPRETHFATLPSLSEPLTLEDKVVSGKGDTNIQVRLEDGTITWLTYGEHFMWKTGDLYLTTDSLNGLKIKELWVYYWINGDAPEYYLGGGDNWKGILEGCGTHYLNNTSSSVFALTANRHFFLETPLLGEVDWHWNWVGGPKPRDGFYKVDILDVVMCTAAYCVRGDGYPNPLWLPGADLDRVDVGHVGILDLAEIASKYTQTFGRPP